MDERFGFSALALVLSHQLAQNRHSASRRAHQDETPSVVGWGGWSLAGWEVEEVFRDRMTARLNSGSGFSTVYVPPQSHNYCDFRRHMATESLQLEGRDHTLTTLDTLVRVLDAAKDTSGIPPAQAAFGSTSDLLTVIRVRSLFTAVLL